VNIQYFATIKENILFIKEIYNKGTNVLLRVDDSKLNLLIDSNNIEKLEYILYNNNIKYWQSEVYFSLSPFNIDCPFNMFSMYNSNTLFLKIGEQKEKFIKESWLATSLDFNDENASTYFYEIGRKIKKRTMCGGFLVNNMSDEQKIIEDKKVRYTLGALEFNKNGGVIYQYNPKIHFKLGID